MEIVDDSVVIDLCDSDDDSSFSTLSPASNKRSAPLSVQPDVVEISDSDCSDSETPVKIPKLDLSHDLDPEKNLNIQKAIDIIQAKNIGSFAPLREILEQSTMESEDFVAVRNKIVESGIMDSIFKSLSISTHFSKDPEAESVLPEPSTSSGRGLGRGRKKKRVSWSKAILSKSSGTGYGSGETSSIWDAEKVLAKQVIEDEQVRPIIELLASYMNPQDEIPTSDAALLPSKFIDLLEQSCLLPVIRSYMRNDSIMDLSQHIPLYRSIMLLIRGIAVSGQLAYTMKLRHDDSEETISDLLVKIKMCSNTYMNRMSGKAAPDPELNILFEDILQTNLLVESATQLFDEDKRVIDAAIQSIPDKYVTVMKPLQFESFDMIENNNNNNNDLYHFSVAYHFEKEALRNGTQGSANRVKRLAQEYATLQNSLPLSYSSSVFVRADSNRLDVMKFMITGPENTPYENGLFIFDVYFPPDFPNSPPQVNLETTGRHQVRFNPNLYPCGKVCLSLLNTWSGRPEEKWNSKTSTFLQVLVSIQSLILVEDPYFNEPGYQSSQSTPHGKRQSKLYNEKLYLQTIFWGMLDHLLHPVACFRDVIQRHFWLKRNDIIKQIDRWSAEIGNSCVNSYKKSMINEFSKMDVPEGLEDYPIETPEINRKALKYSANSKNSLPQPPPPSAISEPMIYFNSPPNAQSSIYTNIFSMLPGTSMNDYSKILSDYYNNLKK